jgi:hypothetical protein
MDWFYLKAYHDDARRVHTVIYACSSKCADLQWLVGPGPNTQEEEKAEPPALDVESPDDPTSFRYQLCLAVLALGIYYVFVCPILDRLLNWLFNG